MAEAIVLSDGCWYIKSPKASKIRTFKQKKNTEILIPIVSKLRFLFGGAGVLKDEHLSEAPVSPLNAVSISSSGILSMLNGFLLED